MKTWTSLPSEIKFLVAIYVFQGAELTLPSRELQSQWSSRFNIFLVSKSFIDRKQLRKALLMSATLVSTASNQLQEFQHRLRDDANYVHRLRINVVTASPFQQSRQTEAISRSVRDQEAHSMLTHDIIRQTFPNLQTLEVQFNGPVPSDYTLNETLMALRQPYLDENLLFVGGLVRWNLDEQNAEIRAFLEGFIARGVCYYRNQDLNLSRAQDPPTLQTSEKLSQHLVVPSWLLHLVHAVKSTDSRLDLSVSLDCIFVGGVRKTLTMSLRTYELLFVHENEEYPVSQRDFQELVEEQLRTITHAEPEREAQDQRMPRATV